MTALKEYARLESTGLWRATPQDQRREVIVSVGNATLTITDTRDQALTHWSLAAVARANPGQRPAIFHPDGDPSETLELAEDEAEMIEAIEKLRQHIERRRPRPGRLRFVMLLASVAAVGALAVFWLPDAMLRHTVTVVPAVKRAEIGEALLARITRVTGQPCSDAQANPALSRLGTRVLGAGGTNQLRVLRSGVQSTKHLPGGTILMNRALVEDFEEPDVAAGYVLAEQQRMAMLDPLQDLLQTAGLFASFRLLTTGELTPAVLDAYAETLLRKPQADVPDDALLLAFKDVGLRAAPYAYAVDVSGEETLPLIEADPFAGQALPAPVLADADWVRLQGICGG